MISTQRRARLFALLLFFAPLAAQQAPPLAGIAHVAIRVHDLAAARAFYQSLGFEEAFDLRRDNIPYESFIKVNDHQFIELYPATPKDPEPAFLHVCFEGDDLQAIHDDYVAHGLTPTAVKKAGAGNLLFTMPGPPSLSAPLASPFRKTSSTPNTSPAPCTPTTEASTSAQTASPTASSPSPSPSRTLTPAASSTSTSSPSSPSPATSLSCTSPATPATRSRSPQPTLGSRARIILQTVNLGRAGRRLSHEHIKAVKYGELLTFADPDGNQILLQQR